MMTMMMTPQSGSAAMTPRSRVGCGWRIWVCSGLLDAVLLLWAPTCTPGGGEDLEEADPPREPGCMSMHNMASRRLAEVSGPPRALDWCAGVACDGCVYSLGGYDYALRSSVADMYIYNPDIGGWGAGPTLPSAV